MNSPSAPNQNKGLQAALLLRQNLKGPTYRKGSV